VRVLIYGVPLAGAAWNIAVLVERIVSVFTATRLIARSVAPTRTTYPTARLALVARRSVAVGCRISGDAPRIRVAVPVAVGVARVAVGATCVFVDVG
jgi:hypothetical protein